MSNPLDLKPLRDKLYLIYHGDGIIDMTLGLSVNGFGIFMATEAVGLLFLAWLPILMYFPLKQALTLPRLGYVRFTSRKTSLLHYSFTALVGVLVLVIFTVLSNISRGASSAEYQAWMRQYHMAVYGAILGLMAVGVAVFSGMKRFYLYGVLAFSLPALGAWIGLATYIPVLGVGLFLVFSGLIMALRFVRTYPLAAAE